MSQFKWTVKFWKGVDCLFQLSYPTENTGVNRAAFCVTFRLRMLFFNTNEASF